MNNPQYPNQQYQNPYVQQIPSELRPISAWGYVGYQILFAIPIIGFIALLVCAIGAKNRNVRSFARSFFCIIILYIVIALVVTLVLGSALPGILESITQALSGIAG